MDLNRLPNDKKLHLCQWYFKVGCAFLPFVWAVNAIWFFKEAFMKPAFEEQKQIKKSLPVPKKTRKKRRLKRFQNWMGFEPVSSCQAPLGPHPIKNVIMSAAGAVAWSIVLATWVTIFQTQRVAWGPTGDSLSFIVPLGRA